MSKTSWLSLTAASFLLVSLFGFSASPVFAENATYEHYIYPPVGNPVLTRLTIWLDNQAENLPVTIEFLDDKPAGVPDPSFAVSSYFTIETELEVKEAKIEFKISHEWLDQSQSSENEILLLKFDNGWVELPTNITENSDTYVYYEATTSSFSLFAAVGHQVTEQQTLTQVFLIAAVIVLVSLIFWLVVKPLKLFVPLKRLKKATGEEVVKEVPGAEKKMSDVVKHLKKAAGSETEVKVGKVKAEPRESLKHDEDVRLLRKLKNKTEQGQK
jgi:PGF-pre-PGF domain-containing protein